MRRLSSRELKSISFVFCVTRNAANRDLQAFVSVVFCSILEYARVDTYGWRRRQANGRTPAADLGSFSFDKNSRRGHGMRTAELSFVSFRRGAHVPLDVARAWRRCFGNHIPSMG